MMDELKKIDEAFVRLQELLKPHVSVEALEAFADYYENLLDASGKWPRPFEERS